MTPARCALRTCSEAMTGAYESIVTLYRIIAAHTRLILNHRDRIEALERGLSELVARSLVSASASTFMASVLSAISAERLSVTTDLLRFTESGPLKAAIG